MNLRRPNIKTGWLLLLTYPGIIVLLELIIVVVDIINNRRLVYDLAGSSFRPEQVLVGLMLALVFYCYLWFGEYYYGVFRNSRLRKSKGA